MKKLIFFLLLVISFSSFALDVYLPKAPPSLPLAKSAKNIKDLNLKYYNDVVTEVIPNIIKNEELIWGLYFKEEANPIIKSCVTYLFLDFIFSKFSEDVNSFVKIKNIQALNFNKNFGFEIFKDDEKYCYLKLSKEVWENSKKSRLLKPIKRYLDKIKHYFE